MPERPGAEEWAVERIVTAARKLNDWIIDPIHFGGCTGPNRLATACPCGATDVRLAVGLLRTAETVAAASGPKEDGHG